MSWVKNKIDYEAALLIAVPQLWDEMRDSIGLAVEEFNSAISESSEEHLKAEDCRAMGKYCRRVSKNFGSVAMEIYLQEKTRRLMISHEKEVCHYRLNAGGRPEFYRDTDQGPEAISTERACELALEHFIFTPAAKKRKL